MRLLERGTTLNEQQISEILREVYGFLQNKGIVDQAEWQHEVEPRIKAAARRIAEMANPDG